MKQYYSKQALGSLFLMCAFPLHLWTLLMAFRDISWVAERTNFGDAIGVVSYGMVLAFLESLLLFIFAYLLGMLIPPRWGKDKRLVITSLLIFVLALWAMAAQLYGLLAWNIPNAITALAVDSAHPLRTLYIIALAFVVPTVVVPILMVAKSKKILAMMLDMVDRVSLLAMIYLLLDFSAVIIVITRNI